MAGNRLARIIGLGAHLPPQERTNADFEKILDTDDEWIVTRTGIKTRRIADKDVYPSTMGVEAAKQALQHANVSVDQLNMIIVATMSGDYPSPSTASLIQNMLGAKNAGAMDIQAACSGFVYALATAKAYIESGMADHVLVIASEKMSSLLDYQDRTTCILFGDGASAALVSSEGKGLLIGSAELGSDGSHSELVIIHAGGTRNPSTQETLDSKLHYFKMNGREVFKHAVKSAVAVSQNCLNKANTPLEKLDWLIPHQANKRMMDSIAKGMGLSQDKVYSVIEKYGNTSAAGVGIALQELISNHSIKADSTILLTVFGGGLTWGSVLLTQSE